MRIKVITFFILAVIISLVAAKYRWGDSSHAIGLISLKGGTARHPSFFTSGKNRYAQITTATVLPPFKGDVQMVLEGYPEMDHRIYLSGPIIDFGIKKLPKLREDILYGLKPRERIALWVLMYPPEIDPICGMAFEESFARYTYDGQDYFFCAEGCLETFRKDPDKYKDRNRIQGKYTLALYNKETQESVLKIPFVFRGKEAVHAGGHHH